MSVEFVEALSGENLTVVRTIDNVSVQNLAYVGIRMGAGCGAR